MQEEHRQIWWRRWWEADYSWEGLAKKPWHGWAINGDDQPVRCLGRAVPGGTRAATLQDFWRAEEGNLVRAPSDQRLWTRIHAPLTWRDETVAKAGWSDDDQEVAEAAIKRAMARLPVNAFEPKHPASSSTRVPSQPKISAFSSSWAVPLVGIVVRAPPKELLALPYMQFRSSAFTYDVSILVEKASAVNFNSCLFNGEMSLYGKYSEISMCRCAFIDDVDIRIRAESLFANLAIFLGEFDASLSKIKEISFYGASFREDASFSSIKAQRAKFSGTSFHKDVDFFDAVFTENATFINTIWSGETLFDHARFRRAKFDSSEMKGSADFDCSAFKESVTFHKTAFKGPVTFMDTDWPSEVVGYESAFREARFERFADFSHEKTIPFSAFNGASFSGEVRVREATLADDESFSALLAAAKKARRLDALGHGLRTLRHSAEAVRDRFTEIACIASNY